MTKQIFIRFLKELSSKCLMSSLGPLKVVNTLENSITPQKDTFWKCFPGLVTPESYIIKI